MNNSHIIGALCAVLFSLITVSANAALVSRLGGAAAYDDVLNITWLTDADLSGITNWDGQIRWVDSLNTANHLGFNDWRLASMSVAAGLPTGTAAFGSVIDCSFSTELACRDNELGYMYYYNLGGTGNNLTGNQTVGDVTLTDIQHFYLTGTKLDRRAAWMFLFNGGHTCDACLFDSTYGWAVRAGDSFGVPIPEVPIPAAMWLFGSGLLGLVGMARRKKA